MTEIAIAALTGLVINIITWLSGKLGISKTYVSIGLAAIIGTLIYVVQIIAKTYPMQWQEIVAFASGSYACSQMIRNIRNKINEKKEQK